MIDKQIIVEYDPRSGFTIPDLEAMPYAEMIVSSYKEGTKSVIIKVGSELLITCFRVLVIRGILLNTELQVMFGSEKMVLDKDSRFVEYPVGYPDVNIDLLLELC